MSASAVSERSSRWNVRYPRRAHCWQLARARCEFSDWPLLMGIVNVTPDSFSDGGQFYATNRAVDHALRLADDGADLLDIGGESTRPYATPVDDVEEMRRVADVIEQVCRRTSVPVSIDTSKAAVARRAIDVGAQVINDVTGLTGDPAMVDVALASGAGVCAMHMRGTPQNMQDDPRYDDVVREVGRYLLARREALLAAGIAPERICLDPGIGFGKTHEHNLTLLAHCGEYHTMGCPLLVGYSRKGFIGNLLGAKQADRLAGNLGVALALAMQGIQLLRVHDVRATRDALQLFAATVGSP